MILSRIGNIVDINDSKKIKRELYDTEKKKNLSKRKKKEKIYNQLVELVNTIDKKETYQYHDRHDLDYYEIRDIENLFNDDDDDIDDDDDDDNYYKTILVKTSFKNNESRGDKDKKTISKVISLQDYAIFKQFNK